MKRPILPLTVFLALITSAILSGNYNYRIAQNEITADLNQALAKLIEDNTVSVIPQDTIRAYKQLQETACGEVMIALSDERFRRYLKKLNVKESAYLTFYIVGQDTPHLPLSEQNIYSDTVLLKNKHSGEVLALKGYSQLSSAAIFSMSDQRMSIAFMVAALLWGAFSFAYLRKNQQTEEISVTNFGGLSYSENEGRFYDATQLPIHFTPMQQQFMNLLWEAPSHTLSKKEICDALWPGKEDANDTLYTLVRRLKPVIEQHTDLKTTADRCGRYILKIKDID